jgi:hypothetical protein
MSTNIADFEARINDADAAIDAEDVVAARRALRRARLAMMKLPRVGTDGTTIDYQTASSILEQAMMDLASIDTGGIISQSVEFI